MAIIIRKDQEKIYFSNSGIVTEKDKKIADKLDEELKKGIKKLATEFLEKKMITKTGRKENALMVWFQLGKFLLNLAKKYKMFGTNEEVYYWEAVYDHLPKEIQRAPRPKRFKELTKNAYRKAALMAQYPWSVIYKVGKWAVWNDILDNPKLLNDKRILDWVISKIIKRRAGHKEIRNFLYAVSRRLHKIDTSVLSSNELKSKLAEVDSFLYF